ncbi:hypothetical protein CHGG_08402 [Chaetomium globosum CBS 148.51]|uniref:LisH domain-containing protein n=1 Tax=Chaetomium globosum (strain ATCC 6205 / CBS 148.51 / DSM 1962 / NBRC 6347 / NRRL 1970) TaxID=306901 RepID=Q2GUF2_CHAGB|nr:uncharacterized protein CHGG_08402 [Chaetomium globosum CBS 148.51]EAQ84388.1 hypothetical protein CHGG_08402 [Chaetomium globosum CBS 148.51]
MAGIPNMNVMGGPVGNPMGTPINMINNGAIGPQPGPPSQMQLNDSSRTLLNTYIYEYFIRYNMFGAARAVYEADPQIKVMKDSPGKHRDENGNMLGNGLGDAMDTDVKDAVDQKRPDDLPAPNVPTPATDSCFLHEWFCLFWDMFNSQKGKGSSGQVNQYVHHTQQQSHMRQHQQQNMLRQMRPDLMPQQQQQYHQMMRGMPNGAMNMGMKPGNQLQRAAMANNQNPQAMQMLHQQKTAGQMQRDPSDMDGNRARQGSPGSADNAPSPTKRPRLEGGAPFNPNQGGMMPNGRPGQGMPGQQQVGSGPDLARALLFQNGINPTWLNPDQLQAFASAPPHVQAKIATYSANMSQHHGSQIPNKPMPNAVGPQGQGSPMVPQGPDGNSLMQLYPGGEMPGNMRPGAPNGQAAAGSSNHALQDYQMQLMLLEQQNKKRLMMARQEQDIGGSPPGGRSGASPNPAEQMKRANQQMANAANMGSPLPDGGAQSRSSPNAMNFMGGNMDPNAAQHFGGMNMNMAAQINGGAMRPPSSHPPFNGQVGQQQMLAAQRQAQQPGAQGAPMPWPQGGPNGQMPGQPPQPQVQGGPGPNQRSMPPPPSGAAAAVAANARNTTASPQVSNAAPPTPQLATKAGAKKKETKATKAKAAAQKKNNPNLNNTAAAAAPEQPEGPQEGPTPATPITPVNPASFAKNQNVNAGQVVANGQPPAPAPQQQAAPLPPPSHADPNQATNFLETGGMVRTGVPLFMRFASDNVLTDFDFDSFLQDGTGAGEGAFDLGFSMEPDTTIGATE